MARGELTQDQIASINATIPDVTPIQKRAMLLGPISVSMLAPPESDIPVASVCFSDAASTMCEVRYALFEYAAHGLWFRELAPEEERPAADFFERYYLDDAAFRLYSAGEDLAQGIVHALELSSDALAPYKEKHAGRQKMVAEYLRAQQPNDPPAPLIARLAKSKDWRKMNRYRNLCVHEQPPLVDGPGIEYARRNRWQIDAKRKTRTLVIGGGDQSEYTTQEIHEFIKPAFLEFMGVLDETVSWYRSIVESLNGFFRLKLRDEREAP